MYENLTTLPNADQVSRGRKEEILKNINITSQLEIQKIDKLRIDKSPQVDEVFPRVLKKCRNTISLFAVSILIPDSARFCNFCRKNIYSLGQALHRCIVAH